MQKRSSAFHNIVSWLSKQYRDVQEYRQKHYPFRILEQRLLPKTGHTLMTVQLVGKSTCLKLTANEIAEDDDLIHGFAPLDVKRIMQAALTNNKLTVIQGGKYRSPFRIIAKNFDRQKNKLSYLIEKTRTDQPAQTETVALDALVQSKETLLQFDKLDIYEIAYSAGAQSILRAEEEMIQAREKSQ